MNGFYILPPIGKVGASQSDFVAVAVLYNAVFSNRQGRCILFGYGFSRFVNGNSQILIILSGDNNFVFAGLKCTATKNQNLFRTLIDTPLIFLGILGGITSKSGIFGIFSTVYSNLVNSKFPSANLRISVIIRIRNFYTIEFYGVYTIFDTLLNVHIRNRIFNNSTRHRKVSAQIIIILSRKRYRISTRLYIVQGQGLIIVTLDIIHRVAAFVAVPIYIVNIIALLEGNKGQVFQEIAIRAVDGDGYRLAFLISRNSQTCNTFRNLCIVNGYILLLITAGDNLYCVFADVQQILFDGNGVVFGIDGVVIFTQIPPIAIQVQASNLGEIIIRTVSGKLQYNIIAFGVSALIRSNIIQLAGDRTV